MSQVDDLLGAARQLSSFAGVQLTSRIAALETIFARSDIDQSATLLADSHVSHELLASAYMMKRVAGQINVVIHAIGILLCLPHILLPGEKVEYLSLGAGNTGRAFDLETDLRVAEFKFIHWQGGTETIRQNGLFKDLYQLAESDTRKDRYMYVLGTQHPLRFLTGGRALGSVMSRNRTLWEAFKHKYGDSLSTVRDYYALRGSLVRLQDVSALLPELTARDEDDDGKA